MRHRESEIPLSLEQPGNFTAAETIFHCIQRRAGRSGQHSGFVVSKRVAVTYAKLCEGIERSVSELNSLNIGRDDRVVVALSGGPSLAPVLLGVSAAAACAPLNPRYRRDECAVLFSELRPKAVIVEAGCESAAALAAKHLSIPTIEMLTEPDRSNIFRLNGEKLARPAKHGFATAEETALLLFTSGTTARPKLVPLTHANLLASARQIAVSLQLTAADRCLNIMPLFHIHGLVAGLLAPLVSGGSAVCPGEFRCADFFSWVKEFSPTWYTAVPAIHQAVLTEAKNYTETIAKNPLRFIRSCSAPLPRRMAIDLENAFGAPVIEAYGMTEASHQIASNPLPPAARKWGSVGKAAGTEIAIASAGGETQPTGSVGEVVIRGVNVMSGYAAPSGANEGVFLDGWLRTGDLGYFDGDGYLFLTGRIKELINRGGEKISPREIDDTLAEHPAVDQAATFSVRHPTLGEDLMAAVVLRPGAAPAADDLRLFAATRLADFKVPRQIFFLNALPRSATGKIQRDRLAEMVALRAPFVAPESELDRMLAQIVGDVLGIARVGVSDNFFALGGDSLRAFQVLARIRSALDVNLSIATIFRRATVAELVEDVRRALAEKRPDEAPGEQGIDE